jgi:hypothetical protein
VTDRFQGGRHRHVGNSSACYKMGNYHPISMKRDTHTKKHMMSSKITKAEVYTNFQDGRRRHFGNSSECYRMGNCHPILMKIGTQTKTGMLSSKITEAEVTDRFQDGCRRHVLHSSACYKMGIYHSFLMKIGTKTKKNMLSSKVTKSKAYGKKQKKIKCKKRYRFKKATLYEREVLKKQNSLFAGRSFHTHTTCD